MTNKILILDGISGVPLAREISDTCSALGRDACYVDLAALDKIPLYRLRSMFTKAVNRQQDSDAFYHLPRAQHSELECIIKRERPSHILVVGFIYRFISPLVLRQLADRYQIKLYLYDTDSCNIYSKRREFVFFLKSELPVYDGIFSFSQVMTDFFCRTSQPNTRYMPYGAMPIHLPAPSGESHDVLFVGSGDLRRIFLLEHIRDHLSIYGSRWERNQGLMSTQLQEKITNKTVWGAELFQLFADTKIILNITRSQFYGAETGINLRIFEALSSGRFLLTDYCDEVSELFELGQELETFKSSTELKEKVEFYLQHPEERMRIAERGHQAFQQRFTWEVRTQALLEAMQV